MSKNIVDGVLVEMSPSMISSFDSTTAFGCERRAWFKYVMGLPEPQTGNQELGEQLHALCEERLLTGKTPSGEGDAFGLYLAGQAMIEAVAARTILGVEAPLPSFEIAGVKLKGIIDVVHAEGIIDWKTSSDIRRYGKTAAELATDTQMVLYGKACHNTLKSVKLAHGQFQTKGRKSTDFVEVEVTQEHLDTHIHKVIIPKVERMKLVASMTNAEDAVPDRKKCFNCAFRARCPTEESKSVMSFFSKLKSTQSSTPVPAGALLNDGSFAVKPPDAPPSKPELAADPVAGFEPVPAPRAKPSMKIVDVAPEPEPVQTKDAMVAEMTQAEVARAQANDAAVAKDKEETAKRGRGRPPGAKNKPKTEERPLGPSDGEVREQERKQAETVRDAVLSTYTPKASELLEPKFKSITVTRGATINVGNFNSVRFDVSVTSEEHTYEEVYAEVSKRLDEEAAKYEAEMAKGSSVPAKGVVSK